MLPKGCRKSKVVNYCLPSMSPGTPRTHKSQLTDTLLLVKVGVGEMFAVI